MRARPSASSRLCTAAAIAGNFVGRARGRSDRGPRRHGVAHRRGGGTARRSRHSSSGGSLRGAPTPAWGPPPARPPTGHRRPPRRASTRSAARHCSVSSRSPTSCLAVLLFFVTFPFLEAAEAAFADEVAAGCGDRDDLGDRHGGIVRRLAGGRRSLLRPIRRRIGGPAVAARLPARVRGVDRVVRFATAAVVQATVQVTQRGLSNAAWSAFYNTVPAHRRAQVMAFQDGVPGQLGTILSGVLLLTAARVMRAGAGVLARRDRRGDRARSSR